MGDYDEGGDSDLEINTFGDFEGLVNYLAKRCAPNNPQANLIFTSWEDLVWFGGYYCGVDTFEHEESIQVPFNDDDYDNYDECKEKSERLKKFHSDLKSATAARMGENSLAAKKAAEEKRLAEIRRAEEQRKSDIERRDQAEWARLRQKYRDK
jgi:hypothetical protein